MTAKRLWMFLPVLAFGLFLSFPVPAQVEGPVETGLAQLAQQIVSKSAAAGKTAIAVLPFPNSDGTCSVLSTFIADELIQNLFSVPNSQLEIVERSQLEAVISELKLGASGLLNPETTKRLGSQSGVSALTVGTITVIGDTVRINARLIATDTGKAISAAAVDIPKVAAVNELLRQPVTTGPICTPRSSNAAAPRPASEPSAEATTNVLYETGLEKGGFEKWPLTKDWKRLDGILINDGSGQGGISAPYRPRSRDYAVEAEIRVNQTGEEFGIGVRAEGREAGYAVGFFSGAFANICRFDKVCIGKPSEEFDFGKDWRTYRVEVKGNTITLLVDNAVITSATDNKFLSPGGVGIWSAGYQLEVRNFRIIRL